MRRPIALVRPPGDSFVQALSDHLDRGSIDPERARAQHAWYREALAEMGFEVIALPPDEEGPDSCFLQDVAVVLGDRALLCRPGAAERRAEVPKAAATLRGLVVSMEAMEAPATAEGGDVLPVAGRVLVGLSRRTNEAGVRAIGRFVGSAARVVTVVVPEPYLHLQTALGAPSDGVVVGPQVVVDDPGFDGVTRIPVPDEEALGSNLIASGGRILMAAGFPAVRSAVEALGLHVRQVDLSEFLKADGGPTCLSLIL